MKKILYTLGFIFLITQLAIAQPIMPPLNIEEEDGSPSTFPYKLKVTNDTLTDNGDGTVSLTTGGGGGSGDVTSIGDCASGACFDGTSDGGTYLDFYDAQGRTRLIGGNTAAEATITLPNTTGTLIHTEVDPTVDSSAKIQAIIGAGVYEPAGVAVADITDASANGRSLISALNYAAMRGLLDLEAGTDFYSIYDNIQLGKNGTDGVLTFWAEQATDRLATLNPNSAMTSDANFYLPADEPAATSFINMTTGGVMGFVAPNAGTDITADLEEEVTEGSLADSVIVSADIKDATIADADLAAATKPMIVNFTITNGNTAIDATVTDPVVCQRIHHSGTITGWYIYADQSGSIVLDIWKDLWANHPPTDADSIAGTEKPTLSTAVSNSDTTLASMTTDWNAGDVVCVEIESASTITKCWLQFVGTRD